MENLLPVAASLLGNHGMEGAFIVFVIFGLPQITDFVERILPLLSNRVNERAIRLAKVNKQQNK